MYIYLRKLFDSDAAGDHISFSRDVAQFYFNAPDSFLSKRANYTIHVVSLLNTSFFTDIELQCTTAFQFSTDLNSFLSDNGQKIQANDLLYVERFKKAFGVKLIKPSDKAYKTFDVLLTEHDRHFILCNDDPEEDLPEGGKEDEENSQFKDSFEHLENSHNIILLGAPGTGKSFRIDSFFKAKKIASKKVFRTTFHPDTDYASFVGAYKPTMSKQPDSLDPTKSIERIVYSFTPQVFTKAYVEAWKYPEDNVFLVIEEINRGNCAQIFGDLFQLLDRKEDGLSKYPIQADTDLALFLSRNDQLGEEHEGIANGELKLPRNMYIWATMNTSDQSLFPMDSAFKRRWEQEYICINYSDASSFTLLIAGKPFDWGKVLHALNEYIKGALHSTNKLLGNRFVQPKEGNIISYSVFRDKVLFYLFSDVFKDDDSFSEKFFDGREGYLFFEDLCEHDDTQISIDFIETLLAEDSLGIIDPDSNEDDAEDDTIPEKEEDSSDDIDQ